MLSHHVTMSRGFQMTYCYYYNFPILLHMDNNSSGGMELLQIALPEPSEAS